jgi:hypothetical protein
VRGGLTKDDELFRAGTDDLQAGGKQIVDNVVDNVKTIAGSGAEVARGVRDLDGKRVVRGAKTLAKVVAVGAITVGAIRVKTPKEDDES